MACASNMPVMKLLLDWIWKEALFYWRHTHVNFSFERGGGGARGDRIHQQIPCCVRPCMLSYTHRSSSAAPNNPSDELILLEIGTCSAASMIQKHGCIRMRLAWKTGIHTKKKKPLAYVYKVENQTKIVRHPKK